MTDNRPDPRSTEWDELCTECGQPRHRHTAPAYADHPWTNRALPPTTKEHA